jgi:protease IV
MSMDDSSNPMNWERKTIEKLLLAQVNEQKAKRRWSIFFRLIALALIGALIWAWNSDDWISAGKASTVGAGKHTAVVKLEGVIEANSATASAEVVNASLRAAFKDPQTAGVVLKINSPGGSPVQSALIFEEIRRLRAQYKTIGLHAVVEEVCASGGYYVAAAADKIHVNQASMIGSIGVLMDGFGFDQAMGKLGIERRLLTAGEYKGFLDPFSPMTDKQKEHVNAMLKDVHNQFIDAVKTGRGERLKNDSRTFTGLVFTGKEGIQIGLADAYGTQESVARDIFKAEDLIDYSPSDNVAERLARRLGAAAAWGFVSALKTQAAQGSWR